MTAAVWNHRSATFWSAWAVVLVVLSVGVVGEVPTSATTVAKGTVSAKELLREAEGAFASASSVAISGYVRDGKTLEEVDLTVLSDGDGSYSLSIKSASAQEEVVAGSVYFSANAIYLKKDLHYSDAQAATYAGAWFQEGSLDADGVAASLSFKAVLRSLGRLGGTLTRTPNRRLNGVPVLGVHSSKSGYLYVSRSRVPYPAEAQFRKKALHEVLRFSGWNSQPEPVVPATDIEVGSNESESWSGYVLPTTSGSLSQVDGNWKVPTATCASAPNAYSSSWIGIDGQFNSRVFQTGTETDCENGLQTDYGWFEDYPSPPVVLDMVVHPGDSIKADVRQVSPGNWNYTLTDLTSDQVVSSPNPIAYPGPGTSAEWIEEDPGDQTVPLTNFGSVIFSNLEVNGSAPNLDSAANGLNMIQKGQLKAQVSQFGNDSFSVVHQ
ncbi:MAG TPA: G1 family glutamic endopeptidase [Acidimicrobiales bacterium]